MTAAHVKTAVMLAAGQGLRLRRGGEIIPKCLVPIEGRPLIAWISEALAANGVEVLHLMLGFNAERIESSPEIRQSNLEVTTSRCEDWALGNGRSAAHAERVVDASAPFFLLMSDHLVYTEHLAIVGEAWRRSPESCVLGTCAPGDPSIDLEDATKVMTDGSGRIAAIGKQLVEYDAIDTGVFVMTSEIFGALAAAHGAGDHSLTGGNRIVASRGRFRVADVGCLRWQDVDTPADLEAARTLARRSDRD